MFCPNCGTENSDEARVCSNCGRNLPTATSTPTQPSQAQAFPGGTPVTPAPYVPNYLVQSILVTIFCCLPFGIVSIIFAAQVNSKLAAGDYAGAVDASKKAKTWAWVSFGVGLGLGLVWLVFFAAGMSQTFNPSNFQ